VSRTTQEKRACFLEMHQSGCFILPNPWNVGSAKMLASLGFAALASMSAGFAWTLGRPDYELARDDVLSHLAAIAGAVDVPVNADFQSGFAIESEALTENVRLAVETGVAGISIEDRRVGGAGLFDAGCAVERIRAARAAIDASGEDVVLVARTETLLADRSALREAIDRLAAFADAGADCLYAPGVVGENAIATMVRAVAPKPLNVLAIEEGVTLARLADLGVRRVSVGSGLAGLAWDTVFAGADAVKAGSFDVFGRGMPAAELNAMFSTGC
jgi:2-methylisocitrate lyase-like PEP mutase family enzyme